MYSVNGAKRTQTQITMAHTQRCYYEMTYEVKFGPLCSIICFVINWISTVGIKGMNKPAITDLFFGHLVAAETSCEHNTDKLSHFIHLELCFRPPGEFNIR